MTTPRKRGAPQAPREKRRPLPASGEAPPLVVPAGQGPRSEKGPGEPLVAIVGAPNVGKSRLFNRLSGAPRSIVHDHPGVTRDRVETRCEWAGCRFRLLDTGGLVPGSSDELTSGIKEQVLRGIRDSSLLVFVVDGRTGLTGLDETLSHLLRRASRPIILAVNKIDAPHQEPRVTDFFALGFANTIPISAEEGRGLGDLLETIRRELPEGAPPVESETSSTPHLSLAIVGRPNVGKSTLFNRLAGEERAVVSSIPGTTRDPVDANYEHGGRRYRIVDTAGLRRKARSERKVVEMASVERALTAMKKANLVVLLMDALEPVTHQDLAVLGACKQVLRPLVIGLNKMDRVPADPLTRVRLVDLVRHRLHFAQEVPVVELSARTGAGIEVLLDLLDRMAEQTMRRFPTRDLNQALEAAVRRRSPAGRGKLPRLYYITQTGGDPPAFLVFTNGAVIAPSYRRYLARQLRMALGLTLAPVSLRFRKRS